MKWTSKAPTKPGWYWWRLENPRVSGEYTKAKCLHISQTMASPNPAAVGGEWSDQPIEEPGEG